MWELRQVPGRESTKRSHNQWHGRDHTPLIWCPLCQHCAHHTLHFTCARLLPDYGLFPTPVPYERLRAASRFYLHRNPSPCRAVCLTVSTCTVVPRTVNSTRYCPRRLP